MAYTMSLVHKIPPMISALAFGYGVGMAAPEATISSVRAATTALGERSPETRAAAAPRRSEPVPRPMDSGGGADESPELSRLRGPATRDPRGAESCELAPPSYSRVPRNQSQVERDGEILDDLDQAGTEALSKLQLPDLKVAITRRTLKYVRFFTRTDRGRGMFETWLKRSGRYQELVQTELRERQLPEDLMWVAMIESGFDPRAKSPAGAVGLWQFMPATGEVYGLMRNRFMDQRRSPRLATRAASHHLRDLYQRFGNWDLALAAYNMGYEQVLDAIDRYGTADFNELARQQAIPAETAAYVPKIAAAAIVANNLEHFGFEKVEVARPVDSAEIAAPPGTPLKTLAKAAGVATSIVRALNPEVLGDSVPPGKGDFILLVPADTVSRARAALPLMLENEPVVTDDASVLDPIDVLEGRELLHRRARRQDESLLALLPDYRARKSLRGTLSDLAQPSAELLGADGVDGEPPALDRDADGPRLLARRSRRRRETVVYRVTPGDTVLSVAKQFGVDADDVSRQNRLDVDDRLRAGSLLKLRVRRAVIDELGGEDKSAERPAKIRSKDRRDIDSRAAKPAQIQIRRRGTT